MSDGRPTGAEPPPPLLDGADALWMLKPGLAFLNHGSFGAVPRTVAAAQQRWRERIEESPVEMIGRRSRSMLAAPKAAIAALIHGDPAGIGLVTNATEGINAVIRSMSLEPGDELIATSHVYNAVRQTLRYVTRRADAVYRELELDPPFDGPDGIVSAIAGALTPRTRVLVIDHISSPTAVVFPIEAIARRCDEAGVDLLVDGAHAPGMVPIDVSRWRPAWYAANLHKWICAPRGCAFLHAREDRREDLHPPTISHFLDEGMRAEFDWQGTRDLSAWLTAPEAIAFMEELDLDAVMAHNHAMATWVQGMLCRRWATAPLTPLDGSMLGSMATVVLPPSLQPDGPYERFESVNMALYDRFAVEVPIFEWRGVRHARASCQVYNTPQDYERLAAAVEALAVEAAPRSTT